MKHQREGDTKYEHAEISLQGNIVVRNAIKNYIRSIISQRGADLYCGSSRTLHSIFSLVRSGRNLEQKVSEKGRRKRDKALERWNIQFDYRCSGIKKQNMQGNVC